jgi:hypothetical protein
VNANKTKCRGTGGVGFSRAVCKGGKEIIFRLLGSVGRDGTAPQRFGDMYAIGSQVSRQL